MRITAKLYRLPEHVTMSDEALRGLVGQRPKFHGLGIGLAADRVTIVSAVVEDGWLVAMMDVADTPTELP
jgi:hypothetical protein